MSDTRTMSRTGVNFVQRIVEEEWASGFQELKPENDDAIDGLIIMRRRGIDTGDILWCQVKAGESWLETWKTKPDLIGAKLSAAYIESHKARWLALDGPAVLVMVVPVGKSKRAWWFDLRDPNTYAKRKDVIVTPSWRTFGPHSKGDWFRLCGTRSRDRKLPVLVMPRSACAVSPLGGRLRVAARETFRQWARSPAKERTNPILGEIAISRSGWRHITRRERKPERVWQSWQLLGVARAIVCEKLPVVFLRHDKTITQSSGATTYDLVGLRARVAFPHRDEGVVQVVIRRKRSVDSAGVVTISCWFHSVYELRRGALLE